MMQSAKEVRYINRNNQRLIAKTDRPGTDCNQCVGVAVRKLRHGICRQWVEFFINLSALSARAAHGDDSAA
jgi:hypothetical protein